MESTATNTNYIFNNWDGQRQFNVADGSQTDVDFVFVKVGDFNGDCDYGLGLTGNPPGEARQGTYNLSVSDVNLEENRITTITVSASNLPAEHIILLPLQFDPTVDIVGVNAGLIDMEDNYLIDHFSNTINLYSLPESDEFVDGTLTGELFSIDVRLRDNTGRSNQISIADALSINGRFSANYADPILNDIHSLGLEFVESVLPADPVEEVTQVFPTVFDDQVNIRLGASYAQGVEVHLSDVSGKVLRIQRFGTLNTGDSVQLEASEGLPGGTYLITIIADGSIVKTQKVIKRQ